MVQTKKFENTFVNEYFAWNLHDQDVEKRSKIATLLHSVKSLIANTGWSVEKAMDTLNLAVSDRELILKQL